MTRHVRWSGLSIAVLALCIALTGTKALGQAKPAKSELDAVTLYRSQAQITRTVAVPKGEGPIELIVTGLPVQVVPSSLFAEGGEAIDVRAVRYRERMVGEAPKDAIAELDEKIIEKQSELEENAALKGLIQKQFAYLDKLESFAADTSTKELSKGVLDAKQLQETTKFVFEQRAGATKELLELNKVERQLKKELSKLQQQRAQLAVGSRDQSREAVLFLDRRDANADTVRLTYLVGSCGWSPSYNVRGDLESGNVRLEYNALIRQMTGEDWDGVELTLSTASPMISASGPAIAGFPVSLKALSQGGREVNKFDLNAALSNSNPAEQSKAYNDYKGLAQAQFANVARLNQTDNFDDNTKLNWGNNVLANGRQLLELCEPIDRLAPMVVVQAADQGVSISYTIEGKVSLQSRADQQMTRIMQSELKGSFYHVANPVLTHLVYREAEVSNTSGRDLLAGPVNVYLGGRFVGRTEMVSVTRGQTFVLGFGADPQLTATRRLVKREQEQQGGNTLLSFDYELSIENYGEKAAAVRLYDRLPNFKNADDVKLTPGEGFDKLSKDKVYLRLDRPSGILRWDVTVAGGATGEEASRMPYSYTLEFDRKFGLSTEVNEALEQQFKLDQQERRKR